MSDPLCALVPQESASGAPEGARSRSIDMTELGTFGRVGGARRVARGATRFRICEPRGGFPGKPRTSPGAQRHARSAPPLCRPARLIPRGSRLSPRRCALDVAAGAPSARGSA